MSTFFKEIDPELVEDAFRNEERCLEMIAAAKWRDGYICHSCDNTNFCKGKKPYSRRCTRCKKEESPTAHTIFHGCHMPLTQAFRMAYTLCNSPETSSYALSREFDTRQMTCWKFKKKIIDCIKSNGKLQLMLGV